MHRCFVNPAEWASADLKLPPDEEHHLLHVLRAADGDAVAVIDGAGRRAAARVVLGPRRSVRLAVVSESRIERPLPLLTLLVCLPKGDRMDWIVEKATELGAARVVPVMSERVVARLEDRQRRERAERWQRIARSAAKQCGTEWLPELPAPLDYAEALREARACDLFLAGGLQPGCLPLREALARRTGAVKSAALLIGPEGDLTPAEQQAAAEAGAQFVTFGSLVLRVDTAALFGLSLLAYELR